MLNMRRVEHLVFLVVPLTAMFTLLIAGTLGLAITPENALASAIP